MLLMAIQPLIVNKPVRLATYPLIMVLVIPITLVLLVLCLTFLVVVVQLGTTRYRVRVMDRHGLRYTLVLVLL